MSVLLMDNIQSWVQQNFDKDQAQAAQVSVGQGPGRTGKKQFGFGSVSVSDWFADQTETKTHLKIQTSADQLQTSCEPVRICVFYWYFQLYLWDMGPSFKLRADVANTHDTSHLAMCDVCTFSGFCQDSQHCLAYMN